MDYRQGLEPTTKIVAGDRRLTMRLMGLWQGLRQGSEHCAPAEDFVASVPDDLWTDCCVVVGGEDGSWELRRIGETIARRSGIDTLPQKIGELPPQTLLAASVRELEAAFESGAPILDEGETEDENGRRALYRSILLPLGDGDGHIVQLFAGARCRVCVEDA